MLCSETLSITSFHYVQVNLQTYYDMMMQNRKEAARWSRRSQQLPQLRAFMILAVELVTNFLFDLKLT